MSTDAGSPRGSAPLSPARAMWEAVERVHAYCYTAPEVRSEGSAAGLKGFWMNYFATRVAPLGPVGPEVVTATFFYYAEPRIRRAIPDAWTFSSPEAVLAARHRAMGAAFEQRLGPATNEVGEAVDLLARAAAACSPIGRVLHAGWAAQPWPDDPWTALWHGTTVMREYRSGNHLIAVCSEGLDGCEAVVSHAADGGAPAVWITDEAAWSPAEVEAATARLTARGWLDDGGRITAEGRAGRERIEALTDRLDDPVWAAVGARASQRLFELLSSIASSLPADDQLDWTEHYPPD
ncbi:MAG: hypothetical protein AAF467_09740 [Actinomycetota bacterium]